MEDDTKYISTGISSSTLLTIVFVVLKLTKVIDWKWIWVLMPSLIPIAIGIIAIIIVLICGLIKVIR